MYRCLLFWRRGTSRAGPVPCGQICLPRRAARAARCSPNSVLDSPKPRAGLPQTPVLQPSPPPGLNPASPYTNGHAVHSSTHPLIHPRIPPPRNPRSCATHQPDSAPTARPECCQVPVKASPFPRGHCASSEQLRPTLHHPDSRLQTLERARNPSQFTSPPHLPSSPSF